MIINPLITSVLSIPNIALNYGWVVKITALFRNLNLELQAHIHQLKYPLTRS